MAKLLLFLGVIAVIYMLVRASNRRDKPPPVATGPESMTQCAHCGLHFPSTEAINDAGQDFCCEDHRRLGVGP